MIGGKDGLARKLAQMASEVIEGGTEHVLQKHDAKAMMEDEEDDGIPQDLDSLDADALARLETRTTNFTNQRVPGPPLRKREAEVEEGENATGKRPCVDRGEVHGLDITLVDGSTLHLSKKSGPREFDAMRSGSNLLQKNIHALAEEAAVMRSLKDKEPEARRPHFKHVQQNQLWVDKHRPKSFLHLLSDERTNRNVLAWIKAWESVVFGKKTKDSMPTGPEQKVLLLHGPPGTGKTTLAHILAKHSGYKPAEINASDERTASGLRTRLEALMEMKAMFADGRPNCIILDEIDGSVGAEGQGAVDLVVKLCKDTANAHASKGGGDKDGKQTADNEEAEDEAEDGEGGSRRRGAKKKHKVSILRRPIICICNDLYAPALRPLRAVAQLIKFTPPKPQRMIARLQHICNEERISVDRQALSLLHEMHNGDIRSCINALQTLSYDGDGHVDVAKLRQHGSSVRDCSMSTGLFDVWNAVFKLPGPSDKSMQAFEGAEQHLGKLLGAHAGNMQLIVQGCHHNMLRIKYNDPRMLKTAGCLDVLAATDVVQRYINQSQNYSLSGYLRTAVQRMHEECASPQWPQIEYPRQMSEAAAGLKQNNNMLGAITGSMAPAMRHFYDKRLLVADVLPIVQHVLEPSIKLANMHLMSAEQKAQLQAHVDIMMSFGFSYRPQPKTSERGYSLALEPNFEELVTFPKKGDAPRQSSLSTALMKHLQQLLEVTIMKKSASKHEAESAPAVAAGTSKPPAANPKTPAKEIKSPPKMWGHAGWASATQHNANRTVATCTNTHPARYRFNEGVTKAIKRTVHMKDLL